MSAGLVARKAGGAEDQAQQDSSSGGIVQMRRAGGRVALEGQAVTVVEVRRSIPA